MSTAKQAWFPNRDEKTAAYLKERLDQLAEMNMRAGQHLDDARHFVEESIRLEQDLRVALRDGVYQLPLNL